MYWKEKYIHNIPDKRSPGEKIMSGYGGKLLKIRQIHLFYFKYPDVDRHDEEAIYYISILSLRMYVLRGRSYRLDYIMNTILGCSC